MLRTVLARLAARLRSDDADGTGSADAADGTAGADDADPGFRPSRLDASVLYAHGIDLDQAPAEIAEIEETARELEEKARDLEDERREG